MDSKTLARRQLLRLNNWDGAGNEEFGSLPTSDFNRRAGNPARDKARSFLWES